MASIVITIETDGAAFHDKRSIAQDRMARHGAIASVLQGLVNRYRHLHDDVVPVPRDSKGRAIGTVELQVKGNEMSNETATMRWTPNDDHGFNAVNNAIRTIRHTMRPLLLGAGLELHIAYMAVRGNATASSILEYDCRRPNGMILANGKWRPITSAEALELIDATLAYRLNGVPLKRFRLRHPEYATYATKGGA